MAYEIPNPSAVTLVAAADLSAKQYYAVKVDSSGEAALCSSAGEAVFGVLQNKPEAGRSASVAVQGVTKMIIGTGGLTTGAQWQTDATGAAIDAASGDFVGGTVLEGGNAGEYATVTIGFGNSAQKN